MIAGPTAAGKTALAIEVAKAFDTAVISADSRQFFHEMHIGTARPLESEMQGVKHYFAGSHSITEDYNVGRFEAEAIQLLDELYREKEIAVLCGGSGLYIDAVCNGLDELPQADEKTRAYLIGLLDNEGLPALQQLLLEKDPLYHSQVDLQNPHRLIRALEVCLVTGKPYSSLRKGTRTNRNFEIIKIGVNLDREALYERINRRVDEMVSNGLIEEAKSVYAHRSRNALQTVGYKELFDHFEGNTDLATAISLIKQNTRRFAKRQLTWFRRDPEIKWFGPLQGSEVIAYIKEEISRRKKS